MCARGACWVLLCGPSTSPLDGMTAILSAQQLRRREFLVLCVPWATALWAGFTMYLSSHPTPLPSSIELLTVLSGAIALLGGLVGVVYLIACTRTWQVISLGVCATACNFGYVSWYAYAIAHQ